MRAGKRLRFSIDCANPEFVLESTSFPATDMSITNSLSPVTIQTILLKYRGGTDSEID